MTPIFWVGTLTSLLILWSLLGFFHAPKWTLIIAYFLAPISGFSCIGFYLKRKPDARYITTDKVDGMGYVWAPMDVLMPYLIQGGTVLLMILLLHKK